MDINLSLWALNPSDEPALSNKSFVKSRYPVYNVVKTIVSAAKGRRYSTVTQALLKYGNSKSNNSRHFSTSCGPSDITMFMSEQQAVNFNYLFDE